MSPTKPITVTVDDETRVLLDKLNELLGVSRSEVIRRGVQAYARELGSRVIPELRQVGAAATKRKK
jgi:metal-responsive CopG/Arc/MetJ family transcriptional regulator